MPKAKASKAGFYAVRVGRVPGVYNTWDECRAQTDGFPAARYKKFPTHNEAEIFAFPGRPILATAMTATSVASSSLGTVIVTPTPETRLSSTRHKPYQRPVKNTTVNAVTSGELSEDGWTVIYTDGACKGNQNGSHAARAGVGVWWALGDERNIAERCPGEQTNNRAELVALVRALETIPYTASPLMLKTDSRYSIQCFESWIHNWVKRGWRTSDGKPVKNAPLIRYLSALLDMRAKSGQKVRLVHVYGHVGIVGNEGADQLANQGCMLPHEPDRDWEALASTIRSHTGGPFVRTAIVDPHTEALEVSKWLPQAKTTA